MGCCGRKDERWIEDRIVDGRMVGGRKGKEWREGKDEGPMEGWGMDRRTGHD